MQDRTVDFEDLVTHMSEHNSPYSRGVIHGVLIDMLSCLQELVLDGKSVRLGELGLFSVLDGKSVRLGELGLFSIGMTTRPADTAPTQRSCSRCRTSRAYTSTCATRRHGATPSCARNAACRSSRNTPLRNRWWKAMMTRRDNEGMEQRRAAQEMPPAGALGIHRYGIGGGRR